MALVLKDRVKETTATTGTGTITLDGATVGYQSFLAIGNANTTYYCIAGQGTVEWEVGIGTYTASGATLSRDTVLASSNSGSAVNFSSGTKDVFVVYPAGKSVNLDASGNATALGTPASCTVTNFTGTASININGTVGSTTPNAGAFTTLSASSTVTLSAGTANGVGYLNGSKVLTTGSALTFDGTTLTANALSVTNGVTLSAGTANGVLYLNGSKVATSGSALVFTGTNLGIGNNATNAKLEVTASTGEVFRADASGGSFRIVANQTDVLLQGTTSVQGWINGTEQMRLTSTGLGIGTSSPAKKLDVNGDALIYGVTVGRGAGAVSTNTAVGASALNSNTTGIQNTANGYQALYSNTTGIDNTANGVSALYNNTTGGSNVANGVQALFSNTTGNNNTANGYQALVYNTTGSNNVANGVQALFSNTTGVQNTANGVSALYSNTTGNNNTANGYNALVYNTTGSQNTANGFQALVSNTTASNNTAVGFQAGYSNTVGTEITAVGYQALYASTGSYNTGVGYRSLYSNTSAVENTAMGDSAAQNTTTGNNNTAVGSIALTTNTTGSENTAIGKSALRLTTTASYNTALGSYALQSNTTASYNTAVGYNAGGGGTTAQQNTLIGYYAGANLTTGSYNCFIGSAAGNGPGGLMTTGSKNTIFGSFSGNQGGLDIRTASNYIVLSDGDGNPRMYFDGNGAAFFKAAQYVSFNSNGYIRTDETNSLALQAGSSTTTGFMVKNNGNGTAMLSMSGNTGSSLALEGATPVSGVGITFPATQNASSNANTLDDYEEGTFTPGIGGTTTTGTTTYNTNGQIGRYTKIGNRCYFNIWLNWSNATGTGSLQVSGLPFQSSSATNSYSNVSAYVDNGLVLSANSVFQAYINTASDGIILTQYPAGGGSALLIDMDTAASIMLAGNYEVT